MKLFVKRQFPNHYTLLVSKITPSEEELLSSTILTEKERDRYARFTHTKRRLEWLTVRWTIQQFFNQKVQIDYNQDGCPVLVNSSYSVSISHTDNLISVLLSATNKAGIDLQLYSPKIQRIAQKFVSEKEKEYCSLENPDQLHIIWSAKEALFKYYSKGNVDFRTNLFIEPFEVAERGVLRGHIRKEDCQEIVLLNYEKIEEYYLVYTLYG